ncbi:MAG: regulatory protein RecX [Candidatus Omnitrophota bacterium]
MAQDFNKALNYAFLLLKYRPRSEKEIAGRLKKKRFTPGTQKEVLAYLSANGYINDTAFARLFVASSLCKGWGRFKIESVLKSFGIKENILKLALCDKEAFRQRLRELIEKRITFYSGKKNAYAKIVRYLASRGFSYSEIIRGLEDLEIYENK